MLAGQPCYADIAEHLAPLLLPITVAERNAAAAACPAAPPAAA